MKETTKRVLFVSIAASLVMTIVNVVFMHYLLKAEKENLYSMTAIVTNVSQATNTVTIEDFNGNLWQFKGVENWTVNDIASCVMDNKGTAEINDDVILSAHYNGCWEGWAK